MLNQHFRQETEQFWVLTPNLPIKIIFEDFFVTLKNNNLKIKKLCLGEHYIIYSNKKCVNLLGCTQEIVKHPLVVTKGIKLSKGQKSIEIYGEIIKWYEYMKQYCTQLDFSNHYILCSIDQEKQKSKICKIRHILTNEEKIAKVYYASEDPSIQKEISILRRLKHKNLVLLKEFFKTNQQFILVFDFSSGGDLSEFIKNRKFSFEDIRIIMKNILEGVAYMHELGIFHRDLKPENILFSNSDDLNSLKIIDFAYADYWNVEHKYLYTRCGTPGFVAPELLQDKKYSLNVDVFSCGVILYMLLTKQNPFYNNDQEQLIMNNYNGNVDISVIEAPEECLDFLKKCLKLNPFQRTSTRDALCHPFILGNYQTTNTFRIRKFNQIMRLDSQNSSQSSRQQIQKNGSIDSPRQTSKRTIKSLHTESPIDSTSDSPNTPKGFFRRNLLSDHIPQKLKCNSFRVSKFKK